MTIINPNGVLTIKELNFLNESTEDNWKAPQARGILSHVPVPNVNAYQEPHIIFLGGQKEVQNLRPPMPTKQKEI